MLAAAKTGEEMYNVGKLYFSSGDYAKASDALKKALAKGGIVHDAALYPLVEGRLRGCCESMGLRVAGWFGSPIAGGDGNREFFIHCKPQEAA